MIKLGTAQMMDKWPWRVLIVISQPTFRETVRFVLTADPRFIIIAEIDSGEKAVLVIQQTTVDLIFIDIHLPGMNGLATAAALQVTHPQSIILLLSGEWSPAYERQAKIAGVRARLAKQTFSLADVYRALG